MRSTERHEAFAPVSVVGRISVILDVFADEPRLSVSELARRSGLPKSTVFRMSKELVRHGFLEHQGADLALGLRFFELGTKASRPLNLRRLTYARMEDLRRQTGHTVHLAVLDGSDVVYVEILRSHTAPKMPSRVGGRVPAYATGLGKALLAFARPVDAEAVIARGLRSIGPRTIVDPDTLRAELERTRRVGLATEREESAPGVTCVAAPVTLEGTRDPVAAISVSGWVGELDTNTCSALLTTAVNALRSDARRLPASLRSLTS
ncbi:IclR family transcriptional regulator [Georgenia thermotolerans]|uniref:IclR family transcriptional regulator n=1 Tax=Georgenia thermotolerans TaxID=527326 RepID=UPI001B8C6EF9|nr:IclR family transcriptional regulator [Georgenia thermotolerans]